MNPLACGIASVLIALLFSACASGARVISGFGDARDGEGKYRPRGPHVGVDVWGNPGDPVLASADGRVRAVGDEGVPNSCGKYVVIDHDAVLTTQNITFRTATRYCHLSEQTVTDGSPIRRGEIIGRIGTTRWSRQQTTTTGYEHVHWELLASGAKIDPLPLTVGCFDPKQAYPTDRLVLTYPVQCKNKN
jgi:murein DD-endopeptidase MepM/ murein hydrolase activator NlpD